MTSEQAHFLPRSSIPVMGNRLPSCTSLSRGRMKVQQVREEMGTAHTEPPLTSEENCANTRFSYDRKVERLNIYLNMNVNTMSATGMSCLNYLNMTALSKL